MDAVAPPKPKVLFEAEPFIPYMREEDFDARLKPVLEPYKKRMGFLPNALKLYAYRPEIAETLFMSHATAKTHVSRLLTKLHARDRAQLVMIAYETGVVVPGAE